MSLARSIGVLKHPLQNLSRLAPGKSIQHPPKAMLSKIAAWWRPVGENKMKDAEDDLLKRGGDSYRSLRVGDEKTYLNTIELPAQTENGNLPVVLAHGYGAGVGMWFRNLHSMSENHRVLAFDWLGCGASARPKFSAKSTEEAEKFFLDSFEEWRQEMGLEKFILCGHSLGGYLSSAYALEHPDKVEKLVLISPVGIPRQPEKTGTKVPVAWKMVRQLWDWNFTFQGVIRTAGPKGPGMVENLVGRRFKFQEGDDEIKKAMAAYVYQISAAKGSGEYALSHILAPGAWARKPMCDRLPNLKMPVAFLYGDNDWMNPQWAYEVAPTLKVPSRIEIVSNSGHHLYFENAAEFNTKLGEILAWQPK